MNRLKGTLLAAKSPPSPALGGTSGGGAFSLVTPTPSELGEGGGGGGMTRRSTTSRSTRRDTFKSSQSAAAAIQQNNPLPTESTFLSSGLGTGLVAGGVVGAGVIAGKEMLDPFGGTDPVESAKTIVPSPESIPASPPIIITTAASTPISSSTIVKTSTKPVLGLSRTDIVNAIFRGSADDGNNGLERIMIRGDISATHPAVSTIGGGAGGRDEEEWIMRLSHAENTGSVKFLPTAEYLTLLPNPSTTSPLSTDYLISSKFLASRADQEKEKIVLLRYQFSCVDPEAIKSTSLVVPVVVKMGWKTEIEKAWIGIVLRYSPLIQNRQPKPRAGLLSSLQFSIPIDSTIVNIQSKPSEGVQSATDYLITGDLSGGTEGEKRALVRLSSTKEVLNQVEEGQGSELWTNTQNQLVAISFVLEGECCSEMSVQIMKRSEAESGNIGQKREEVKEESVSGRYLVYA